MTQITQITQSEGNTNPRFRKVAFTLNNYTDSEFTQLLDSFADMKYAIGKEVGEEGTPHLQGYVEFGKQLSLNQLKKINNRMHIEKCRGNREQNRKYCCKEGNFVSTLPVPLNERLLNKYSDVIWKDWQSRIIEIISREPDNRTVHWFYEESGNVGKSFLCKYLYLKHDALICSGKKDDVFNQVKIWLDSQDEESPPLVICDIPRSGYDFVNYGVLEKLKDGLLYSGKYEGGVCALDNMHVVCFANEAPLSGQMSHDRWDIQRIN